MTLVGATSGMVYQASAGTAITGSGYVASVMGLPLGPDLSSWTRGTAELNAPLQAVAFGADRYVAVGANAVILSSP